MNLVDCFVTKVLSKPYEHYGMWCVDVEFDSYGHKSKGTIYGLTKEEADKVDVGYKFLR